MEREEFEQRIKKAGAAAPDRTNTVIITMQDGREYVASIEWISTTDPRTFFFEDAYGVQYENVPYSDVRFVN